MSDKNIQADFFLVDPESAKLIEEELDQLKTSLAKKVIPLMARLT